MLVDESDPGDALRWLFYLEHSIRDARLLPGGQPRVVSRRMQFVEIDEHGNAHEAGYAPYLNYRPLTDREKILLEPALQDIPTVEDAEAQASSYAIQEIVPGHYGEVKRRRLALIEKTAAAVRDRLTKEINYWDHRAEQLRLQELAGKVNAKINSGKAQQRADELQARLERRMRELSEEVNLSPLPPVLLGQVLVIPQGLLNRLVGDLEGSQVSNRARETKRVEMIAMKAVLEAEKEQV